MGVWAEKRLEPLRCHDARLECHCRNSAAESSVIVNESETTLRYCIDVVVSATLRRGQKINIDKSRPCREFRIRDKLLAQMSLFRQPDCGG